MKDGSNQLPAMGAAALGTGAALTAAVAGACCVGPAVAPILLSILGTGGLIAAAGLHLYTPWLLLASGLMLAYAFRQVHRARACSRRRVAQFITYAAAFLWCLSATYALYGFLHE